MNLFVPHILLVAKRKLMGQTPMGLEFMLTTWTYSAKTFGRITTTILFLKHRESCGFLNRIIVIIIQLLQRRTSLSPLRAACERMLWKRLGLKSFFIFSWLRRRRNHPRLPTISAEQTNRVPPLFCIFSNIRTYLHSHLLHYSSCRGSSDITESSRGTQEGSE